MDRLSAIYDVDKINDLKRQFDLARETAKTPQLAEQQIAKQLQKFENRRCCLDVFMKELNQRISMYINDQFDRRGTLWEAPYGSTLIQGTQGHYHQQLQRFLLSW